MNLDEEKQWMLSKRAELLKLHKAGEIDGDQMMWVMQIIVSLEVGFDALEEALRKGILCSKTTEFYSDRAKMAFNDLSEYVKKAHRSLLKEKLKELEEGKLNVS